MASQNKEAFSLASLVQELGNSDQPLLPRPRKSQVWRGRALGEASLHLEVLCWGEGDAYSVAEALS